MAGRDTFFRQEVVAYRGARQQRGACDDDVVVGVQADDGWRGHSGFLGKDRVFYSLRAVIRKGGR
jgi:hypothetical protein